MDSTGMITGDTINSLPQLESKLMPEDHQDNTKHSLHVDLQDSSGLDLHDTIFDIEDAEALTSLNKELSEMLDVKNTLRTPPPTINLSPFECHTLQQDEIQVLKSIYDEDFTPLNESATCFVVKIKFLSDEIKEEDVIRIWFSLPDNYPCVPPIFEIETNQLGSFNYRDADNLFDLLMEESLKRIGEMMVFDLITLTQEHMPGLVEEKHSAALRRQQEEKERKERMELEESFNKKSKGSIPDEILGDFSAESASVGKREEEEEEEKVLSKEEEYRFYDRPKDYIGPISEIVKKLPEGMQITRIENVMRRDLARRFHHAMKEMTTHLWKKARANPQMYDLTPSIAFHGTRTKSLPSIVHHGLVIPGSGNNVKVRCGSSLGLGIYLSPFPDFSFHYSDSDRLIVCAVLLGRIYKGDNHYTASDHYHCHSIISSCGSEWVVFNAAQVLPCYVIQVSNNSKPALHHVPPPLASLVGGGVNPQDDDPSESDKKAKLLARAKKFLPYGYGPGKKTVIEDAASFDDDEEDYGDYQLLRHGEAVDWNTEGATVVRTDLQEYRFKSQK